VTVWRIGEGGEAWWQRDGEARRAVWRLHGGILFWRRTHSFPGVRPFRTGRMYSTCQPAISGSVPVSAPLPSSVGRWVDGVHGALTTAWAAARKHVVRASPPPQQASPLPSASQGARCRSAGRRRDCAACLPSPRGGSPRRRRRLLSDRDRFPGESGGGGHRRAAAVIECVVPPPCPEHAPGPCTESPGKQVARGR